jgi:tetratricopeptide (TPR) repeat protein
MKIFSKQNYFQGKALGNITVCLLVLGHCESVMTLILILFKMSKNDPDSREFPIELAETYGTEIKKSPYTIAEYYEYHLTKNIQYLRDENIIDPHDLTITEIKVYTQGKTEKDIVWKGKFTVDLFKGVLHSKHKGLLNTIKATIIAHSNKDWKIIYNKYYENDKLKLEYLENNKQYKTTKNTEKKGIDTVLHHDITPFDKSEDNYDILILPFCNPEKNNEITSLGENLSYGLIEKNNLLKPGLKIRYLSSFTGHITNDKAREIGNENKADMVIWGNDSKLEGMSPHIIYFHYVITPEKNISSKILMVGKTDKFETDRLIDIKEGALQLEIDDIILWFWGNKLYVKKDFKKAIDIFNKIKYQKYQNENLYFYIAASHYYLRQFDKAKVNYIKSLKINPNFTVAHYNYSVLLEKKFNDIEKAKEHYEKALQINPFFAEAHSNYAGILFEKLGNIEKAKEHYEIALDINPSIAVVHNNYAVLLHEELGNIEKAKEHYEKALEIDPNLAGANYNYANLLYEKLGNSEKAKEHYEKALEIDPYYAKTHLKYAVFVYLSLNESEKAKKHFEKALEINPNHAEAHFRYAIFFLVEFNDIAKAKEHYEKALEINPNFAETHYHYANLLYDKLGNIEKAKEHYKKTLEINPNHAEAYVDYAVLLEKGYNDIDGAIKFYKKALKINPNFAKVYYNYANLLYEKLGNIAKAKEHYEKALKIDPNIAEAHYNYAILLNKIKDYDGAKKHYMKAIHLNPDYKTKVRDDFFRIK